MSFLKISFLLFVLWLHVDVNAQSKPNYNRVNLIFHTMVGNMPMQLDSNYQTPLGDTFSITKFKFFIGKIGFVDNYGKTNTASNDYYLINENDDASKKIEIPVLAGQYKKITFSIGVDSIKNVSGVQTGALDPATGMFWTWNSGYIMAKLEGKSPQSKAPFNNITYHIGGFRQKDNVMKVIFLPLYHWPVVSHKSSVVIDICVDLNKWFDGPHPIKISEKSFCMSPGKMAMEIADNYANMFSIKSISVK